MKIKTQQKRKGFTLLELTVAIMVGMSIGAMVLAMLNQQIAFLRIFRAQSFLNEEAPLISAHVSKLLINAERFSLYGSLDDALAARNPRLGDSPVMVLRFRQPDGSIREGILSWDDLGQGDALYYYVRPLAGALGEPEWAVTNKPTRVSFFVEDGIIRTLLVGPAREQITFSGAMQ
ncbi:type II secretion system protein [Luteolibacter algae]|uniref:Type II secretion system protein n=1 Tax=Luteolibacter algae TaxID=454151 RepID=A0ABW5D4D0_9BACT